MCEVTRNNGEKRDRNANILNENMVFLSSEQLGNVRYVLPLTRDI